MAEASVSFSFSTFAFPFSVFAFLFPRFSIRFCWLGQYVWPVRLSEIEMTLSVIWFGQRFHWQLARAAAGQAAQSGGGSGAGRGGADEQQVFGVAVSPLWHVARKLCVIYRQIVLRREVFVAKK